MVRPQAFIGFFLMIFTVLFISCGDDKVEEPKFKKYIITGEAQGTTYKIQYIDTIERSRQIKHKVDSILAVIEGSLSTYNANSTVSKFNYSDTCTLIDDHLLDIFFLSDEMFDATDGAFDPTVKPLLSLWGFGEKPFSFDSLFLAPQDSLIRDSLIAAYRDSIASELTDFIGFEFLMLDGDIIYNSLEESVDPEFSDNFLCKDDSIMQVTFDGIAQGYSIDVIAEYLEMDLKVFDFLIFLGGEVLGQGLRADNKPWRVQIEHPDVDNINAPSGLAEIDLANDFRSVSVSGNYRNFVEFGSEVFGHTIDPRTGFPAQNKMIQATVFAESCAIADAYSTAFMVMGPLDAVQVAEASAFHKIEAFLVYLTPDSTVETYTTSGLEEYLILPEDSTTTQLP